MSKKPLYIELLTYIDEAQQGDEWVDLNNAYQPRLADKAFYQSFKEEITFLSENNDILTKGNIQDSPEPGSLNLFAKITETGEHYLRSYQVSKLETKDRFTTTQIAVLMSGIIGATVLLAFFLAYFFG